MGARFPADGLEDYVGCSRAGGYLGDYSGEHYRGKLVCKRSNCSREPLIRQASLLTFMNYIVAVRLRLLMWGRRQITVPFPRDRVPRISGPPQFNRKHPAPSHVKCWDQIQSQGVRAA